MNRPVETGMDPVDRLLRVAAESERQRLGLDQPAVDEVADSRWGLPGRRWPLLLTLPALLPLVWGVTELLAAVAGRLPDLAAAGWTAAAAALPEHWLLAVCGGALLLALGMLTVTVED